MINFQLNIPEKRNETGLTEYLLAARPVPVPIPVTWWRLPRLTMPPGHPLITTVGAPHRSASGSAWGASGGAAEGIGRWEGGTGEEKPMY